MLPPMPALLPTGKHQQQANDSWEYVGYRDPKHLVHSHYYLSEQVHSNVKIICVVNLTNFSLGQSSDRSGATNGRGEIPS